MRHSNHCNRSLSDPFDDAEGKGNGFEMELFVETADIPAHARGPLSEVDPFKRSWAFELVEQVAKAVADAGESPTNPHGTERYPSKFRGSAGSTI